MRTKVLLLVASLVFAASCAHDPKDAPLTPAEKQRMIEAEMARESVAEDGGQKGMTPRTGCSSSSQLSRYSARGTGFSGADGFDTRGCNAVGR